MPSLISRANEFISPYFPNFHFRHVDIWNSYYNPSGKEKSHLFCFPYSSESFNFAFLTSVFTHLLPKEVEHYLSEIYRVLTPGGTCLLTCFLLTDESQQLIKEGKAEQKLIHLYEEGCFTYCLEYPESSIGYEENKMFAFIKKAGFSIKEICYGSWCGRQKNCLSYQDIVIVTKPS